MSARRIALRFSTLFTTVLATTAIFAAAVAVAPTEASGQVDARMLRQPDVSQTHIAFVYAGDIWIVEKEGGTARRLSSPRGAEQFPRFSPDGSRIAFSGFYDGNPDVYTIPALGGEPTRVTYHPGGDRALDWTPDGNILFASGRETGIGRVNQLFTISPTGGLPNRLPVPYGEFGAISPDGGTLAYTPKPQGFSTWKRYQGGTAADIWLFDLGSYESENITENPFEDGHPMWHGETIYFASNRGPNQRLNLWASDRSDGETRQVTEFRDFDISFPAIGPEDIVFQAGGSLYLMDLATEAVREVQIDVVTDLAETRPHTERVGDLIQWANISPTGQRAVFQARGEIFTVPAEDGVIRKLTRTSGAAERYPSWSPDGKYIAYMSDATGEYELTIRPADGTGEEERLTRLGEGLRYNPFWSPDSKKIAFWDYTQTLNIYDVDSARITEVDTGLWRLQGEIAGADVSWSHDSRWLAYHRGLDTNNDAVFLFDTETGQSHQVTSGYYSDYDPFFDPDGEYLYYLSNRSLAPIYSDLDATWIYTNTTRIVAVALRDDVPSPLAPENDEEPVKEEETEGEEEGGETEDAEGEEDAGLDIDLDGFEARGVVLPQEPGNYSNLTAATGKVIYTKLPRAGSSGQDPAVVFFDLGEKEEKTIIEATSTYDLSADGKKMLVASRGQWGIVDVAPGQSLENRLATGDMEMMLEPRAEWAQMFNEVWRTYRDVFYDPNMHGLDWEGLRRQYGELLEDAVTRSDVNFVIGELIGEVNASHTYVGGGDLEAPERRQIGLLGIDWSLENGAYRISRIVESAPWMVEYRSPLNEPGVDASAGDYILAVNGTLIEPAKSPYAAFEGLAGKTVLLHVNDRPTMEGAREVVVETMGSESQLRHQEWIELNRRYVEEVSGGQIGYIYVINTAVPGQTELVRQFNSQMTKPGLIIDERWNGGGQLADRFIEKFNRPLHNRIYFRNGGTANHPAVNHYGHKAMLINGWAGSGGDAFPWFFQILEVGPVIGERTWGGLIGPASGAQTIDGGFFTAPPGRLFGPDGVWFAEGHGVDPDIPVVDDPTQLARGIDPQLVRAVEEVMRMIQEDPVTFPGKPAWERRSIRR
jgi:tricorn protease